MQSLFQHITNTIALTRGEEEYLSSKIRERTYLKNQYILQQGDVCKHVNFILNGCAKMFFVDNGGEEHIVMFAIEDWWASDLSSFITQTPSDYNIQCLETTTLTQFTHQNMEDLYANIPRLERFFRKLTERALVASQKRIIQNFSLTAKERYLLFKEHYPTIEQRIPQYMIASYLGITKEFLSKIKKQLVRS